MKSFVKYIMSVLAFALCLSSCSEDPNVPIHEELDFTKCLRPVNFKCNVQYVDVTINFKAFPDAEAYQVEAYSTDFLTLPEGEEPLEEDCVYSALITGEELPYTFQAPEEITCHVRVRAVNETAGREPSEWVTGRVKTDVDPATRCGTPTDFKIEVNYNRITGKLVPLDNVAEYVIELYSAAIPSSGDPDPANLIDTQTILPSEFPITVKGVPEGTYYYRIQGRNEEAGLKPSKWVNGSFKTTNYWWRNTEGTFDYNLGNGGSRETKFNQTEITALLPSKATGTGTFTWDGVTYGPQGTYSNDKWYYNRCKSWDNTTYAVPFPLEAYEMIEVTQPGTLSFIPRAANGKTEDKMPEVVLGLLAERDGVKTFEYVYKELLVASDVINTKNEANRLTIEVTEDHLYGITAPAQLYLFMNLQAIHIYPLKWTRKTAE